MELHSLKTKKTNEAAEPAIGFSCLVFSLQASWYTALYVFQGCFKLCFLNPVLPLAVSYEPTSLKTGIFLTLGLTNDSKIDSVLRMVLYRNQPGSWVKMSVLVIAKTG